MPGEVLIAEAQSVLMFSPVSDLKQGISGVLSVTNFKLTFITSDDSNGEVIINFILTLFNPQLHWWDTNILLQLCKYFSCDTSDIVAPLWLKKHQLFKFDFNYNSYQNWECTIICSATRYSCADQIWPVQLKVKKHI